MEKDWMDPNVEGKEAALSAVKKMYTKGDVVSESKSDDSLDTIVKSVSGMDIDSASALVTMMVLETLEENGFVKMNVDVLTDIGREIGHKLIGEEFPLDGMSTMGVLLELFGQSFSESEAMVLTDMILLCHERGVVEFKKLVEAFEESEANDSSDEG